MAEDDDSNGATRAARYRELAAALRTLALSLSPDAREECDAIARHYDVLAEHAEQQPNPT